MGSLANRLSARACQLRPRSDYILLLSTSVLMFTAWSLGQSAASKSTDVRSHLHRADAALKQKDIDITVQESLAVLALDPRNPQAYVNLGVVAFLQADYASASQNLRKALALRPSLAQAQALLGICRKRLGDPSAKHLLESSFAGVRDVTLRTQVGMELAGLYQQQGDSEHAVPVVQKLVELNPDDPDILFAAQRLYRELADDTLNKLAVLAPGSARMQQVIAQQLINAGDVQGAIEHYKKALAIDPMLAGVHYELAEAILESGPGNAEAQDDAEKELATAITTEGDSSRAQCKLGKIALLKSDSLKAYGHYSRGFALNANDPEAQLGLGRVLMTMEKPQEARKYLELAVRSDPLNSTAHYRLAVAYRHLQMPEESQKQMHLFEEIKQTKARVRELYRQMNKQSSETEDELPADK